MKWTTKKYKIGDFRIRSGFLLFPKTIKEETRWLIWTTWKEERFISYGAGRVGWAGREWIN